MKNTYKGEIITLNAENDRDYMKINNLTIKKQETYHTLLKIKRTCS